jgi:hypothetical protein
LRTKVERIKQDDDPTQRTRIEAGTRIGAQLTKLAICLAYVLGRKETDDEVIRICRKVALDSCKGYQQDVFKYLASTPHGMTKEMIADKINISAQSVYRTLRDLREINIVKNGPKPNNSGRGGRDLHYWHLTDEARTLAEVAGMVEPDESSDVVVPVRRRRRMARA